MRRFIAISILLCHAFLGNTQTEHDECIDAYKILDPIDWCSDPMQFSNSNATPSGFGPATCFDSQGNDLWFSFKAFAKAMNVVVIGRDQGNTLNNIQVAMYSGDCTSQISELACASDITNNGAISILENGLNIGETYYIRVSGRNNNTGTFSICTNNYNPPVEPGQDCHTGAILCDKSPFVVQVLTGGGAFPDEGSGTCLDGFGDSEDQSTWLKWTAANNGSLTFTITPLLERDDIDFALFELDNIDDCGALNPIRCMATACSGPTGLDFASTDLVEDLNCDPGEDGFVKFIDMVQGQSYGLLINNFSNSSIGFLIEFGGDGEFVGPTADFSIDPEVGIACDQEFTITNLSSYAQGNIVSYEWDFGDRAIPANSNSFGPHNVTYESFGEKYIVLSITSDKGCEVTAVKALQVDSCCASADVINIDLINSEDPTCWDSSDGIIEVNSYGSHSEFQYSINGGPFLPTPLFQQLLGGNYQINTVDIKGCTDSIQVELIQPDTILVDAGEDATVKLGETYTLDGGYSPNNNYNIVWSPESGVSDISILDPEVFPFGTTQYTLTVSDENGCQGSDEVIIRTDDVREIHAPNVISANNDGLNDFFNVFGNRAISTIETLSIYDRWGNKIFQEKNVPVNDQNTGWNGQFNGKKVNPGVYVWYARVLFIDGVIIDYAGDITVL